MDILDKLVIPQPEYNLVLMNYLLMFGMVILLVFTGGLFGSTLLSIYHRPDDKKNDPDGKFARFSREMAGLITSNVSYAWGLGIVPFLAIIFMYAQLLHKTGSDLTSFMLIAFVLYVPAVFMIFKYKKSLDLSNVYDYIKGKVDKDDSDEMKTFEEIGKEAEFAKTKSGRWGLILLFISMWFFLGSMALATDVFNLEGNTLLKVTFSIATWVKISQFLTAAMAFTSILFLFLKFGWEKQQIDPQSEYGTWVRKYNFNIALIMILTQPLFYIINLVSTPNYAVDNFVFGATLFGVFLVFLVAHFLYANIREGHVKNLGITFVIFIIAFGLIAIKEKASFSVASKSHILVLNKDYKEHKEEFIASLGLSHGGEVNAEEIYNGRCAACHKAEDTPQAPSHKNAVPKYAGKMDELKAFILNPVPVNPKWPTMPNQGVTPAEAEALAEYLLNKYAPESMEGGEEGESMDNKESEEMPAEEQNSMPAEQTDEAAAETTE
jgi:cytochrome c